ncbi:hypothetical protein LX32DRAFT_282305 [Colletotrichum zoysiae]|uniref:Uncharacterized protein n=1 Tax=Colletotrichum zoysiae TaxID=1216348 RepID=A0AAD9H220_9PEZI|nr:hypothetical protein LX32DRAFT_282305 [Colletotrichum zoysiae]
MGLNLPFSPPSCSHPSRAPGSLADTPRDGLPLTRWGGMPTCHLAPPSTRYETRGLACSRDKETDGRFSSRRLSLSLSPSLPVVNLTGFYEIPCFVVWGGGGGGGGGPPPGGGGGGGGSG